MDPQTGGSTVAAEKRARILIVQDDLSARSLLSTFLASMGCDCVLRSSGEALATVEDELFDAVLLDTTGMEVPAEKLVAGIKSARPSLSGRLLAITGEVIDPQTLELIELHGLPSVPRDRLVQRLWGSLQSILIYPRLSRTDTVSAQMAKILYDSFHQPLPTGLRSSVRFGRQFVFIYENVRVDMVVEPQVATGRVSLVGQVLDAAKPEAKCENLPVVLVAREGPIARTTTNALGEFHLDCQFPGAADLKIRVGEGSWVVISLGDMEWVRKRLSGSEASA